MCTSAAAKGPFTVNLWMRANASDADGDLFEYVYSHSGYATRQKLCDGGHVPPQPGPPAVCVLLHRLLRPVIALLSTPHATLALAPHPCRQHATGHSLAACSCPACSWTSRRSMAQRGDVTTLYF